MRSIIEVSPKYSTVMCFVLVVCLLSEWWSHRSPFLLSVTAIHNTTNMVNLTISTPDMASSGSYIGKTLCTTSTTTTIATATDNVGESASTVFWIAVAFCLFALGLTVTSLYVVWRKKKVMMRAPEGKENLIAELSWGLIQFRKLFFNFSLDQVAHCKARMNWVTARQKETYSTFLLDLISR